MRKPGFAAALLALSVVFPPAACAAGARAHPPAGAGSPRYPYAHLVPGLVVHRPHRPARQVIVLAPVAHRPIRHAPHTLQTQAVALDGDTFDSGGARYRLYGIDTPERGEPLGAQARARLQQLLAMGPVTVIPVAVDVYGRHIAQVVVAGWNVAAVLRAEGFAKR